MWTCLCGWTNWRRSVCHHCGGSRALSRELHLSVWRLPVKYATRLQITIFTILFITPILIAAVVLSTLRLIVWVIIRYFS